MTQLEDISEWLGIAVQDDGAGQSQAGLQVDISNVLGENGTQHGPEFLEVGVSSRLQKANRTQIRFPLFTNQQLPCTRHCSAAIHV